MFSFNDPSPILPTYQRQDAYAPDLGGGVPGGDPRMDRMLAAKRKSPFQSFLDYAQQGQNVMGGGGGQDQQQGRKGILGGIKEIGSFFL